ncbi:hypothetical protein MPRM_01010 [Mycobacterium parmense]|uniref:Uncharacterized protein n=2 Tax=Mycobacterium parmense TaxID=185642 RepID=A0A7I7YLW3_9MYCO|nr:NAD-dependent epimerase/dehydratase family protein [Mycobacterium parmense]ORW57248.1 hypothetical protein AWC20_14120 [Mycobacterium parmense]BBZ42820.1 hypothetical protein MPRM_01010 [Mycobacterium parmense]
MRLLVTGATGCVGSRLVTALLTAGHQVGAANRDPKRLADLVESWDHPRVASASGPRDRVPDPMRLVDNVPGPLAGAVRTGLDVVIALTPKVRPA